MDKRKFYNLEDPEHVQYLLATITDEMAEKSDAEGDEDADDNVLLSHLTDNRSAADSSFLSSGTPTDVLDDEEPFESEVCPGTSSEAVNLQQNGVYSQKLHEDSDTSEFSNSSKENISDDEMFDWQRKSETPKEFSQAQFNRRFGITRYAQFDVFQPVSIFLNVLSPIFLQYLVDQSNLYGVQRGQTLNLTVTELKAYIGILIIMGFHTLPSIRLYWSTDQNFTVSRIQNVMPLKRFLKITRFLHVNDNSIMPKKGESGYDRLYKIRPFLDYNTKRFKLLFDPSRYLSIDESMVKFKGRSTLKQYMPMKPIKRGFKVWVIACAVTGYCLGMSVYEGAEVKPDKTMTLGEKVVNNLSTAFEGFGYCLFFDNFFSTVLLARKLLVKKLFICSTIRQTRKLFPRHILADDKKMKIGESDGVIYENTAISKWKDRGKKSVSIISTIHNPQETAQILRTQKDGSRKLVGCPVSVAEYNKYMGGVDHFDQLLSAYSVSWKSRRWWLRIFYYCLDSCIINSYILHKTTIQQMSKPEKAMTHLKFRSTLASQLIGSHSGRIKYGPVADFGRGRKRNNPDGRAIVHNVTRLNNVGKHLPIKGTRRRCCHCSTLNKQQRSNIICSECKVALCLECFAPFHKA